MYKPNPIDTSKIKLSDDLHGLIELLAENVHDNWALKRIGEGWSFGPNRDDLAKKHPDLLPYHDLPEVEKEYDRKLAIETLKVILASGYQIQKS
jgi:hypothetical protein